MAKIAKADVSDSSMRNPVIRHEWVSACGLHRVHT